MASRRTHDDSDEEEATALELRTAPSAPQKAKPTPVAPPPVAPSSSPSLPSRAMLGARALPPAPSPPPSMPAPRPTARPSVSSGLDDDDDDDATEFLQARPARKPSPASSSLASPPSAPSPRAPTGSPAPASSSLPRAPSASNLPSASEPALRARGRAVPLGDDAERSVPNPPAASAERSAPSPRASGRDATEPLAIVDGVPRGARPLPDRSTFDESTTGTASVPRITRIQVVHGTANATTDDGDGEAAPDVDGIDAATVPVSRPSPRAVPSVPVPSVPVPSVAVPSIAAAAPSSGVTPGAPQHGGSRPFTATTDRIAPDESEDDTRASTSGEIVGSRRPGSSTGDDAAADGTLVIEAPPDAVVVVNGVERGRGHVRVGDLDRHARHAVRIHRPGFHTWSGSVSLDGKPAAKIRPTLKPRAR